MSSFLSGFVSIVGCPNVGKSTIINAYAGQKISIVSSKPQTTRNRIHGVLNRQDYQIVFIDTPGINNPKNKLGEYMIRVAYEALNEVECVLYVVDAIAGIKELDAAILTKLSKVKAPVIAAVNKIDAVSEGKLSEIAKTLQEYKWLRKTVFISAQRGEGLEELALELKTLLPAGPKYYPDDMVTDQPERVICQEMIREKMLMLLSDEIPHGIGVEIEKIEARSETLTDIFATIYCERESHKRIIIGSHGDMLKQIGILSRRDIEWLMGTRVNLQLWIKVKEDWRNSDAKIRQLGYE